MPKMMSLNANGLAIEKLRTLAHGDQPAGRYILELFATLQDDDEELRAWASDALQTIQTTPHEMAATIAEQCANANAGIAAWACKLLTKTGSRASEFQAAIAACLRNHSELHARQQAAQALSEISGLSPASITALEEATQSNDPRLKRLATQALQNSRL